MVRCIFLSLSFYWQKRGALLRGSNFFCYKVLPNKNAKWGIVRFFILAFRLAKSIEYIDHIFLDCANIFYSVLELVWKKIGHVLHRGVTTISVMTPSLFSNRILRNQKKRVLTRSRLVVTQNLKGTLPFYCLPQIRPLWSYFWVR